LIEPKCLQVWDIQQKKLVTTIPLPNDNEGTVYDFLQKNGVVHLTFTNTLYNLALSDIEEKSPPAAYLLSAKTSGTGENVFDNTVLPYYENTIQFNLSTPSYVYPEASYFMYRLLGVYDTSWKKIDGPVYDISFTSLKPGNYYFEAYAVNFQNIRSANTIRVHFKINRPLWQQVWFSLMVGSIIFIAFLLIFLQRLKNIRLRNQLVIDKLTLQNELRKSLLRTIIAQMNPHFVFNALNTIQSFVYKNDKISVSNYMGKFSELIRKILDTSNIDAITLQEEIEIINLYLDLEKARFEEDFNVQLKVAKALEPELIEIPPMFIQPYIENAIKHGLFHKKGSRHLAISIDPDPVRPGYIRIIVEDDGIGRARSIEINSNLHKKHKSFASSALENRINLINQTLGNKIILHITDKPNNAGTIVTIELPIIKSTI
jgi:sensor histidine kinase YesM